jgi:hypothetical protein
MITGYESGYENIREPEVVKVEHRSNSAYYDGEFEGVEDVFEVVVLGRGVQDE